MNLRTLIFLLNWYTVVDRYNDVANFLIFMLRLFYSFCADSVIPSRCIIQWQDLCGRENKNLAILVSLLSRAGALIQPPAVPLTKVVEKRKEFPDSSRNISWWLWGGVRDESRGDYVGDREIICAKHSLHDRPISPATKANETNYLHDFTVALHTDNSTWILV